MQNGLVLGLAPAGIAVGVALIALARTHVQTPWPLCCGSEWNPLRTSWNATACVTTYYPPLTVLHLTFEAVSPEPTDVSFAAVVFEA